MREAVSLDTRHRESKESKESTSASEEWGLDQMCNTLREENRSLV